MRFDRFSKVRIGDFLAAKIIYKLGYYLEIIIDGFIDGGLTLDSFVSENIS